MKKAFPILAVLTGCFLAYAFYQAMFTKRLSPASALRDAQLSLLRQARWSDPHYWAAFGIQGDWK